MDAIWYKSLTPSKSAYQVASGGKCNPAATVNGCGATNWYTVFLSADDDDGNLANGTPNACRIWDAFNAHGIACGSPPDLHAVAGFRSYEGRAVVSPAPLLLSSTDLPEETRLSRQGAPRGRAAGAEIAGNPARPARAPTSSGRSGSPCSPGSTGWPSCARTRTGPGPTRSSTRGIRRPFSTTPAPSSTARLYDNGIPFHPPGFAWVLAAVHTLVGAGAGDRRVPYVAVKVVIALIGSLPVGLLYLLVKPYLGRAAALVAALLCAWSFGLVRDRRGAGHRGDLSDAC